jgi:hypothetical protein
MASKKESRKLTRLKSKHFYINRDEVLYYGLRIHLYDDPYKRLNHTKQHDYSMERTCDFYKEAFAETVDSENVLQVHIVR